MTKAELLKKANELPERPGVYTMYDSSGQVIYVGKAVSLKNRVTGYFRNTAHDPKTTAMVASVDHFSVILCSNELDALITECSLIKLHNPFFNIKLKEGHGYPFIHVFLEDGCPQVRTEYTRTGKGRYFGPYAYFQNVQNLVALLRRAFRLPTCKYRKRSKPCLEYDMKRCVGSCAGKTSLEELKQSYEKICAILEGKTDEISGELTAEMEKAAQRLDFEEAILLRDRLKALEMISTRQRPVVRQNRHADYIGFRSFPDRCCIFMLRLRNGYVVGERCDIFEEPFSDSLLREYVERFYTDDQLPPGRIYLKEDYDWVPLMNQWLKGKVGCPVYGQDKQLLELADRNASERMLQYEGKTQKIQRQLNAFCELVELPSAARIEVYDISQTAGADVVCGMVSYLDGQPDKRQYKRFRIRQVLGMGDTDYMKEAVGRRLDRFREEDEKFMPLPDLIVCDGGLGQVHAVQQALEVANVVLPVVGLKKDSRHRTRALVFGDGREKLLTVNPEAFSFCGRMQEEVHRFAISYHKALRDKSVQQSRLMSLKGVGKVRARALFLKFKSVDRIRNATEEELCSVEGISPTLAHSILQQLQEDEL